MSKEKYQKQWEAMSQRIEKAVSHQRQQSHNDLNHQMHQQQQQQQQQQQDQQQQQQQQQKQKPQHECCVWGYNIGIRLVDEFLAKSGIGACGGFRETAEVIAKFHGVAGIVVEAHAVALAAMATRAAPLFHPAAAVAALLYTAAVAAAAAVASHILLILLLRLLQLGLRMFLGVSAEVTNWDVQERSCSLVLSENPLADFVELPPSLANLNYCNLICGVIRGSLEQLRMRVACYFVKDMLKGDDVYEIKLELKEVGLLLHVLLLALLLLLRLVLSLLLATTLMKEEFEDDEDS
ncbi:hypothetical protein Emag_002110 [Eimeria magna]